MTSRDIVITGIGVVSPVGIGRDAFATSLAEGRSGVRAIERYDTGASGVRIGAELADFEPKPVSYTHLTLPTIA